MTKPAARTATDPNAALLGSLGAKKAEERPTKGARAGLRAGEIRLTIVLRDDQNDVLHDWAHTTGRTFREVSMSMADYYIENVIKKAVSDGVSLKHKGDTDVPEDYADLYGDTKDEFGKYF